MRNDTHTISNMDDLLNLPDIGGIIRDLREDSAVPPTEERKDDESPKVGNPLWSLFLENAKRYDYRVKKGNRRNYEIDNDLVDILRICNICQMSISDIINAALRTFLQCSRPQLAQYARNVNYLINAKQHETSAKD